MFPCTSSKFGLGGLSSISELKVAVRSENLIMALQAWSVSSVRSAGDNSGAVPFPVMGWEDFSDGNNNLEIINGNDTSPSFQNGFVFIDPSLVSVDKATMTLQDLTKGNDFLPWDWVNEAALTFTPRAMTYSFWINTTPNTGGTQVIMDCGRTGLGGGGFMITRQDITEVFGVGFNSSTASNGVWQDGTNKSAEDGTKQLVTVTTNASGHVALYVNTTLIGTSSQNDFSTGHQMSSTISTGSKFRINGLSNTTAFNKAELEIGGVFVWKGIELSLSEIGEVYSQTVSYV